jgi:hypothetical protein
MAVLHEGAIRYVGTPAGLLERHGTRDMEQAFLACIETSSATGERLSEADSNSVP